MGISTMSATAGPGVGEHLESSRVIGFFTASDVMENEDLDALTAYVIASYGAPGEDPEAN